METDPLNLGPSITLTCLAAKEPISNDTGKLGLEEEGRVGSLDFICFVCNNEFDDMAKLHVHMSMKHKGIKVCCNEMAKHKFFT